MNYYLFRYACLSTALVLGSSISEYSEETVNDSNLEYVTRLNFTVNDAKLPFFIYDSYLYNSMSNISTNDIIMLAKLETYNIDQYTQLFAFFNVSKTQYLSMEGLETILNVTNMQFRNLYNDVLISLNQRHTLNERNALISIGINTGAFSEAMEFGTNAEAFAVFKAGNFSNSSLEGAVQYLEVTLDDLFLNTNKVILNYIKMLNRTEVRTILESYNIMGKNLLTLVEALNSTYYDVMQVDNLKTIVDNIIANLTRAIAVGVITDPTVIKANKEIYDMIQSEENIIKIRAISLGYNNVYEITNKSTADDNYVNLNMNGSASSYIRVAENSTAPLINCSFITLLSNSTGVSVENNSTAIREDNKRIVLSRIGDNNPLSEFVLGSPLICRQRLYGMANGTNISHIFFNPIYGVGYHPLYPPVGPGTGHPAHGSAAANISLNFCHYLAVIINVIAFFVFECL